MTEVLALFHAGLTVRDIERTVSFYRDIVGMTVEPVREYQSAAFDQLTNNSGAYIRWTYATLGEFRLQFIQYLAGGEDRITPHHNRSGSLHLSFYVGDAETKFQEVRKLDSTCITSELVFQPGPRMLSFYVQDPDGVPVEFLQRLDQ